MVRALRCQQKVGRSWVWLRYGFLAFDLRKEVFGARQGETKPRISFQGDPSQDKAEGLGCEEDPDRAGGVAGCDWHSEAVSKDNAPFRRTAAGSRRYGVSRTVEATSAHSVRDSGVSTY